jgi:hypothetical protein
MFKHFIGSVYSLEPPPKHDVTEVDFPVCTQDDKSKVDILLQINSEDLSEFAKDKINHRLQKSLLPDYIIKQNLPISIDQQDALAKEIDSDVVNYHQKLNWSGVPKYDQLNFICDLMFRFFNIKNISTSKQLTCVINNFFMAGSVSNYIQSEINNNYDAVSVSEKIDRILYWIRNLISYQFPRNLIVIETIHKFFSNKYNLEDNADYSFFSTNLKNLHMRQEICALDEYGIPYQTAEKLQNILKEGSLDDAINGVLNLNEMDLSLHDFEKRIIRQFKDDFKLPNK